LADGESVLIHGAAGAVGQAAICLAQMVGAEVYGTVSSLEKKELLMREYGLPSDHIFYSRCTSFSGSVLNATDGKGVDVILNSLTGEFLRESWSCLSKFGRFIDIGKRDQTVKTRIEMSHVDNNASFISVDLLALAAERPKLMKRLVCNIGQLLKYGKIRPVNPVTVFPISQVDAVFKSLHSSPTQGKIVIMPQTNDMVKVPNPPLSFVSRAPLTFLLGNSIQKAAELAPP
jgi:NADPH:quinone reductase-like Zn-dependent oxidoreductase